MVYIITFHLHFLCIVRYLKRSNDTPKLNMHKFNSYNIIEIYINRLSLIWPTKYTALYVTFWRPKLRGQFSENLELWIYEFLFNSGDRLSKKKIYGSSENWKFKIWQTFSTNSLFFLINTLLFVRIEQRSKTEVPKQPFKCVP